MQALLPGTRGPVTKEIGKPVSENGLKAMISASAPILDRYNMPLKPGKPAPSGPLRPGSTPGNQPVKPPTGTPLRPGKPMPIQPLRPGGSEPLRKR
jgi:hypothetical protein